ncbi:RluA family pseudouridine synthase [Mycoplasma sp. ES3157-GEN-MYC]|uniref:Pseudouridine synthase n=1 Tax=Mycoplasma miroungigenitalium TaxID=754515 RepID=A0A6M4JB51_9MOLU|nr:RluA family pseudouridine synthase [Mycoplasma miroungigenitalium]MBU4690386.1 RluA family pseudouridine synthase [Mycoplasma miroungigenitalium]MBU4691653.1 RluA family pseudouridine synthase [Mycoplasma miroungigenitalium]QJR43478.1 RluA family pseudouridine synthase [Mycoplasma miroungigenitalium]
MIKLEVTYKDRIDKYISDNTELSRNDVKQLILQGAVLLNDNTIPVNKPKYIVQQGWNITITKLIDKETNVVPRKMDLDIVYEDDDLVVLNKPTDLVVHPAPGHHDDTLVNGLLFHFKTLSNENGLLRPGIVHRIDKDTSGLLIIAKNNETHVKLVEMLKNHEIHRSYLAICDGLIENKTTKINLPINRHANDRKKMTVHKDGKDSITTVYLLKHFYLEKEPKSLVRCQLETGRTHQIRVHLKYIGHPIYGDPVYNKKIDEFNQRLHAYKLEFIHPISGKKITVFAPIPNEFNIADFDFNELKNEE